MEIVITKAKDKKLLIKFIRRETIGNYSLPTAFTIVSNLETKNFTIKCSAYSVEDLAKELNPIAEYHINSSPDEEKELQWMIERRNANRVYCDALDKAKEWLKSLPKEQQKMVKLLIDNETIMHC